MKLRRISIKWNQQEKFKNKVNKMRKNNRYHVNNKGKFTKLAYNFREPTGCLRVAS